MSRRLNIERRRKRIRHYRAQRRRRSPAWRALLYWWAPAVVCLLTWLALVQTMALFWGRPGFLLILTWTPPLSRPAGLALVTATPADATSNTLLAEALSEILGTLTDREADVLRMRFGMYDGRTLKLSTLDLWGLRAKAVTERVSLPELGRVLCHINRKRGYRTVKSDYEDKKQGEYVKHVVERYREIHGLGLTVGQYIYGRLQADPAFRYKDRIYPRDAYVEEYDAVMECQRRFYPEVLTDEVIGHIRNYIIFHQRPLKSCKHLVGRCELERRDAEINGRTVNCGPRVAPRSSPLFQVCRIWECINNLRITGKRNDVLQITMEQKRAIFDFMNTHGKMTATNLKALLGIKSRDWQFGRAVGSGLQGNTTRVAISDALGDIAGGQELLRFDLRTADGTVVDTETGEIDGLM